MCFAMIDVHVNSKNSAKSELCRVKTAGARRKLLEIEISLQKVVFAYEKHALHLK